MLFGQYDESSTKPWWYPRHFGVTLLDIIGVTTALLWFWQSKHWTTDIYLLTLVALYAVSGTYHHVCYRDWLAKLDHIMIFYVVAITALPYWGKVMPWDWYNGGILLIVAICLIGTLVKTVSFLPRYISGLAYIAGSVPMVSYFLWHLPTVQAPFGALWLVGIVLYGIQLTVYTIKRPDPYTELFGYREIQHIVLLVATNLHSFVALSLV